MSSNQNAFKLLNTLCSLTKFLGKVEIQDSRSRKPNTRITLDGDKGKVEIQDSRSRKPNTRITLDGDKAGISAGGNRKNGDLVLYDTDGKERMKIGAEDNLILAQRGDGGKVFEVSNSVAAGTWLVLGTGIDEHPRTPGFIEVRNKAGNDSIFLDGANHFVRINGFSGKDSIVINGGKNSIGLTDRAGRNSINIDGGYKFIALTDRDGRNSINIDGANNSIVLTDKAGRTSIWLDGNTGDFYLDQSFGFYTQPGADSFAGLWIGAKKSEGKKPGKVFLRGSDGNYSIVLDGANNSIALTDKIYLDGNTGKVVIRNKKGDLSFGFSHGVGRGSFAGLWIGGNESEGKKPGKVFLRGSDGNNSIVLDGAQGDILLEHADCAEDFDIVELAEAEPGNVMVISEDGKLQRSSKAYDRRVAGVISGAGDFRPGLVFDKKQSHESRRSISLMGKVYCKVDADSLPVEVGDMLTTSFVPGHAMKASDPLKAFGAVIGKALRPLREGKDLIPILIALQ